ncbi:baseplate J/gp47 family protein [Pseudomonas grimontii]|uniref:baseplate J/gp47 family protein n=1 Tax=Pseudomonas grimontii TaxID=129847 RepID=UPI00387B2C40
MPYDIPTLPALITRTEADFERNAPDALRRSDAKAAARAHSGTAFELYGYQQWIAKQSHPATCDEENLLRWADWRLEKGRTAAVAATGPIAVTGVSGSLVDVGVVYQYEDGRLYTVTQTTTLVAGAAVVPVTANDVGTIGNLAAGTLTAVSPVVGVNSTATIGVDGIVGGTDQETVDALRGRVRQAFKNPSKVGNSADFIEWALEVPGVTRAWALPRWMGPGTFGLTFVRDADVSIFPTPAQVAEVQAHLDARRPVTAEVYAFAPIDRVLNFSIKLTPDSTALRTAVTQSLAALINDEAGADSTLLISHIRGAINNTAGETDHVLTSPNADVVIAINEVASLGVITWL